MSHRFTVILETESTGGFHAFCPALKGCHSEGDTEEEAMQNIQEAVELYLESFHAHGEAIPTEDLKVRSLAVAV
jgi:predicted RNase H-like HicB family nuclease